ncbi:MAG: hypothetical protein WAN20_03395 [Pseudonocardiaceae bacterium]
MISTSLNVVVVSVASCDWYHESGNLEWAAGADAQQEQDRNGARLLD